MGTNANTVVRNYGKVVCNMYQPLNGKPAWHGRALLDFLAPIKLVQGIKSADREYRTANGMDCLAAQMVAHFKYGVGDYYLAPARDRGADYTYEIRLDGPVLEVTVRRRGAKIFQGGLLDFERFIQQQDDKTSRAEY